jgi:hypothetical protein
MQSDDQWVDDRVWEHRLPIFLFASFCLAAGATLASRPARSDALPLPDDIATITLPTAVIPAATTATVIAGLVSVQIADVILPDGTASGVVLLEDKDAHNVLPVFLKAAESATVRESLRSGDPHSAPELLSHAIQALRGEVQRIEITQGAEEAVSCRVVLSDHGREVFLDARPADALALAATTHAPVYTTTKMLDSQGIRRETVERLPGGLPSRLRNPDAF